MGILNAVNDAVQGISNLTRGALGGSLAQPNFNLFGLNIPGVPLVSFRDAFIKSMESWIGAIPLRTQFIVLKNLVNLKMNPLLLMYLESGTNIKKI